MGQRSSAPVDMTAAKVFVDRALKGKTVVVFSKDYCPFCRMAKEALSSFKLTPDKFDWIDLCATEEVESDAVQSYLQSITGSRTVPQVFIGGKYIGGGSETSAAKKSGSLERMLKDNGAI